MDTPSALFHESDTTSVFPNTFRNCHRLWHSLSHFLKDQITNSLGPQRDWDLVFFKKASTSNNLGSNTSKTMAGSVGHISPSILPNVSCLLASEKVLFSCPSSSSWVTHSSPLFAVSKKSLVNLWGFSKNFSFAFLFLFILSALLNFFNLSLCLFLSSSSPNFCTSSFLLLANFHLLLRPLNFLLNFLISHCLLLTLTCCSSCSYWSIITNVSPPYCYIMLV